tara:strand:- start:33896 stop:34411 length:516 start_codon:yes stop_codon:yes gene_type:complete
MLGLGNTLTASGVTESIIELGSFVGFFAVDAPDDENVVFALSYTDSAINDALNFEGISAGEKTSGTFSVTITRLDSSDNPVAGASTTGALFGYKTSGAGAIYLSDQDQASFNLSEFESGGSALVDVTTFGDVTDITDNSVETSNYTISITFTAPGYTTSAITLAVVDLDTA